MIALAAFAAACYDHGDATASFADAPSIVAFLPSATASWSIGGAASDASSSSSRLVALIACRVILGAGMTLTTGTVRTCLTRAQRARSASTSG